jgi:DNA-binding NarL/FixJ family response regulator
VCAIAAPLRRVLPGFREGRPASHYDLAVPIRVVIAEDNALLRQGIAGVVSGQADMELVGAAADLGGLRSLLEDSDPDVVVTDIRMPPTSTDEGVRVATELRGTRPGIGVVVLSQHGDPAYAVALLEGGTGGRAYLLKDRVADVDDLLVAIREVAAGRSVIDPQIIDALVTANRRTAPSDLDRLTARELEVLEQMAQGKSNAAIAATLFLSERAIEKHSNAIFSKLGLAEEVDVNRRVKAVLLYLQSD